MAIVSTVVIVVSSLDVDNYKVIWKEFEEPGTNGFLINWIQIAIG